MQIMYADGENFFLEKKNIRMLGEIQGGFRRGMRTEENVFILERLIEMVKGEEGRDICGVSGYEKSI